MKPLRLLLPARLGSGFRWLWWSSTVGNLGDGVLLAAGPLLVASVTREPLAVATALFLQRFPWLLFGIFAGALIDRTDRRLLIIVVDLARAAVLGLLAITLATGYVNLAIVYIAMFLIGTAETVADNAGSTLIPMIVPEEGLGQANARVYGAWMVANQLAGPPLGAFLFGIGLAYPFGFNAICFVVAVVLVSKMTLPREAAARTSSSSIRADVAEGLKWLWSHAPVRTLAIMITVFNITFGAALSVWVLYAYERLGLDESGFGWLMAAPAVGGVLGSALFRSLERRFRYASLLRVGLVIETCTHLGLALTTTPLIAGGVMFVFGVHAVTWGTTSTTVRQRAVPESLLGRVTSVYLIGGIGALALGTLLGGAIAQRWGVTAPLWFAFVGSAITTLVIWRSIANVAHAADVPGAGDDLDRAVSAPRGT